MEPFLAEIKIMPYSYAPRGWAFCDGQMVPIAQNQALFALLGTTYGGNGQSTFALPDLRGRTPVQASSGLPLGGTAGEATHTLSSSEMATHTHIPVADSAAPTQRTPVNNTWTDLANSFGTVLDGQLNPTAIASVGGSLPHSNLQPYLVLNFFIAMQGIFPSRN